METMKEGKIRGLSGTALKLIALGCMLLDHIHYFFAYTGKIPGWFSVAGRLAAPIFIFCLAEGFAHTRSRRKYFLNIYVLSILMGLLHFFMQYADFLVRPDGFFPQNGILSAFVIMMVMWQGMDWIKGRKLVRGILAVTLPLVWPFAAGLLSMAVPGLATVMGISAYTVLPACDVCGPDCSLPIILTGILLYGLRGKRKLQAVGFMGFTFLYYFVYLGSTASKFIPDFTWGGMFTDYVEWYGMFAGLLMLLYNGQRGAGLKRLFYVFYPAHIYLLYALSWAALALAG